MTLSRRHIAILLALLIATTACQEEHLDDPTDVVDEVDVDESDVGQGNDTGHDVVDDPLEYPLATCDDLDPEVCAYPWPSNLYLAPDQGRATGYRLQFSDESLPANTSGTHLSPSLVTHLDGYDLGVPIMVRFPHLDGAGLPDEYHIEESMSDEASILLFQVLGDTLRRVPYWAELDVLEEDPALKTLFIRPALILEEGARYLVVLRDLVTLSGDAIDPSPAFSALVEGHTGDDPVLVHRQERFDDIFARLADVGIEADELTLAWDFVTASSEALHGPMLTIRDDAFEYVDAEGIEWTIDEAIDPDHEYIGLELRGSIEVPHYMEPYPGGSNAWMLHLDDDGQIERNGTRQADILVRIPHRGLNGDPLGVIVYGHGLLGSRWELHAHHLGRLAEEYGYALVAVDLVGMSNAESTAAILAVTDANHFVALSHRLHQGILEYLLAARTAGAELGELDELTDNGVVLDTSQIYYMGGSQGGIFGATFMALSPDVERGYLAVPGNNYSTLLHRSTNFVDFNSTLELTYPASADRNLVIATLNLMWSTTEPVSFLRRIRKEPFDGTPKDVLLAVAKGDWQVATITNENVARSDIGIPLLANYDFQRQPYGAEVANYPHQGSGIVLFDFGNPWPAPGNDYPRDEIGDPHGRLSGVDEAGVQLDYFLRNGEIIDVCDDEPCRITDL